MVLFPQEQLSNVMLLTTYKEGLVGFNLITITNEVNDDNDERQLASRTFKIQDYVQVHEETSFCLYFVLRHRKDHILRENNSYLETPHSRKQNCHLN